MKTIALGLALLVVLATSGAGIARADDDAEAKQRALVLLRAGNQAAQNGDHTVALEKFQQAYAIYASPNLLINIGTTFMQLGRFAEAAETYEKFLADPKADPAKKPTVQQQLALLETKIGRLRIQLDQPGARVVLDGRPVGGGGVLLILRADPGSHTLVATKKGFEAASATVAVAAGQVRVVELKLEPKKGPPQENPDRDDQHPRVAVGGDADRGGGDQATEPTPTIVAPAPTPGGGLGGVVRLAVDVGGPDFALIAGGSYGLGPRFEVQAAAIVAGSKGVYLGATVYLTTGSLRPTLGLGAPIFFLDGVSPALRAAAGLAWLPAPSFRVTLDLGLEQFLRVPDGYVKTLFVPSLGLQLLL